MIVSVIYLTKADPLVNQHLISLLQYYQIHHSLSDGTKRIYITFDSRFLASPLHGKSPLFDRIPIISLLSCSFMASPRSQGQPTYEQLKDEYDDIKWPLRVAVCAMCTPIIGAIHMTNFENGFYDYKNEQK